MESTIANLKAITCKTHFTSSPVVTWNYTLDDTKLRIFKTTQSYPGNLNLAAMDAACASDTARPFYGSGGFPFVGLRIGLGGVGDTRTLTNDFPLKPNTQYYREDGVTLIGSTNSANNGFVYPMTHSISALPSIASDFAWTGLDVSGSVWNLASNTCSGWSSLGGTGASGSPWSIATSATSGTNNSCSLLGSFYCVERIPLLEPFYRWRFENNYQSSTANAKTGTAINWASTSSLLDFGNTRKEGDRSLQFTGTWSQAYYLGSSVDFGATNLGSQFSFTLWVSVNNVSLYSEKLYTILSNQLNTKDETLGFSLTVNKRNLENQVLHAQFGSGSVKRTVESNRNAINYNTWTHIALTVDYTTGIAKLYKNGIPLTLATAESLPVNVPGSQSFRLGSLAGLYNYRGFMDDVHYYNKTLTDAEVLSIYNSYEAIPRL
jgi:hypothetical protein